MLSKELNAEVFEMVVHLVDTPLEAVHVAQDLLAEVDEATQESVMLAVASVYLAHGENIEVLTEIVESFWGYNVHTLNLLCEALAFIERAHDDETCAVLPEHSDTLFGYLELRTVNGPALCGLAEALLENERLDLVPTWHSATQLTRWSVFLHLSDTELLLEAFDRGGVEAEIAFLRLLDLVDDPLVMEASAVATGVIRRPLADGALSGLSPTTTTILSLAFPETLR